MLPKISLVDLRGNSALELSLIYRARTLAFAQAATGMLGTGLRTAAKLMLPAVDHASRKWLQKSRNPYAEEIGLIANAIRVPGVYAMNVFFEWACTTGGWQTPSGPLLRRVVDWPIPRLGEFAVVARQSGKLGEFFNATWPGYSGMLQAMAPGRFAAAANLAPMRKRGAGLLGDWLLGRFKLADALPPTHLLRRVFETARDYTAAKSMLSLTPIAVPTIFTLTGTRNGEACVIERTEDSFAVREMSAGRVCAANQFETPMGGFMDRWRPRPIDSAGRYAMALSLRPEIDGFGWFVPPIANPNSRLVVTANAATGALKAMGTDGVVPVTEAFDLAL
jgi:hypothetical protein